MLNSERAKDYYSNVIKCKNKVGSKVSKIRDSVENAHREFRNSLLQYYEYIRMCFKPLIGKCYMEHNYCVDGVVYPTVYYVITGTSSYSISKYNDENKNPREITTESASGYKIDDSDIFRLPVTYICIEKTKDPHLGDCNGCLDCNDSSFHIGDFKCIFDSEQEEVYCATFTLKTGYITVPFTFEYLDNVVENFTTGRTKISVYQFDYVVNKFENYIKELAQRNIYNLHENIERAVDRGIVDSDIPMWDLYGFGYHKYLSKNDPRNQENMPHDNKLEHIDNTDAESIRNEIKQYRSMMDVDQRKNLANLVKNEGFNTSLSKIEDCNDLKRILYLCQLVVDNNNDDEVDYYLDI